MPGHGHEHHHDHDAAPLGFDSAEMAAFAEMDGEIFLDLTRRATAVLADLCDRRGLEVRRVVDLGSGPGVGSCCLAERFALASVVAADGSTAMLDQAKARAARLGLASRVE